MAIKKTVKSAKEVIQTPKVVQIKIEQVPTLIDLEADMTVKEVKFVEYFGNVLGAAKENESANELRRRAIISAGKKAGYNAGEEVLLALGRRILYKLELQRDISTLMAIANMDKLTAIMTLTEIAVNTKQTGQARTLALGIITKCHGMQKDVVDSRGARVMYFMDERSEKAQEAQEAGVLTITGVPVCPVCAQMVSAEACGPAHRMLQREMGQVHQDPDDTA